MAISAHQDDIEIMAFDGILKCFQNEEKWFMGVVLTDGRDSPRDDLYKGYTDEKMRAVRRKEQKKAAVIGEYGAQALLDYPSTALRHLADQSPVQDLTILLKAARPHIVYTHNPADKHETHIAAALLTIRAIRELPPAERPEHLYGCEVWRDLDWMVDEDKTVFEISAHENLQSALLGVFDSQIYGGKRYDLATMGRRRAHATYLSTHKVDVSTGITLAMDLTPLIEDSDMNIRDYVLAFIARFSRETKERLDRLQKDNS